MLSSRIDPVPPALLDSSTLHLPHSEYTYVMRKKPAVARRDMSVIKASPSEEIGKWLPDVSRCQTRPVPASLPITGSGSVVPETATRVKPAGIIEQPRRLKCLLCLSILELSSRARMVRTCLNYYCLKYVRACVYIDTKGGRPRRSSRLRIR